MKSVYDCGTCGACCDLRNTNVAPWRYGPSRSSRIDVTRSEFSPQVGCDEFVRIRETDHALPGAGVATHADGSRYLVMRKLKELESLPPETPPRWQEWGCKCFFHEGTVGCSSRCTVYEDRPEDCREVPPGTELCVWARLEAGLGVPPGGFLEYVRRSIEAALRCDGKGYIGVANALADVEPQRLAELWAGSAPTSAEHALFETGKFGNAWSRIIQHLDPLTSSMAEEAGDDQGLLGLWIKGLLPPAEISSLEVPSASGSVELGGVGQ